MASRLTLLFLLTVVFACLASAQSPARRTTVATLLIVDSEFAREVSASFEQGFRSANLDVMDSDLARAAAQGSGSAPSLNMALSDARTLGAALGSDFYLLIDAQTLRRSSSSEDIYFETYASIFLVSSRTGRLWKFLFANSQAPNPAEAERRWLTKMAERRLGDTLMENVRRAQEDERTARALAVGSEVPVIETAPDDHEKAAAEGLQLPRPFRRLQPPYPSTAAIAEVEAMVDVLVDLDKNGEITGAWIARWAGFGLDEATLETVRKLHFFPALRDRTPVPLRVLLRYNFRKPPR